jgi:hypothetical protein
MKPTTLSKNPNPLLSYILPLSSDDTFTSLSEDSSRHHQAEQQVNLSVSPISFSSELSIISLWLLNPYV